MRWNPCAFERAPQLRARHHGVEDTFTEAVPVRSWYGTVSGVVLDRVAHEKVRNVSQVDPGRAQQVAVEPDAGLFHVLHELGCRLIGEPAEVVGQLLHVDGPMPNRLGKRRLAMIRSEDQHPSLLATCAFTNLTSSRSSASAYSIVSRTSGWKKL
ncbi:hypothetical protein BH20ACT22_BH20ACT22_05860 [soil metagenome]